MSDTNRFKLPFKGRAQRLLIKAGIAVVGGVLGLTGLIFTTGTASADGPLDGGGNTTIGGIAINESFNRNEILSGNAVNVCGLALCNAQVIDYDPYVHRSGGYTAPDPNPMQRHNPMSNQVGGQPTGKQSGGDTTVGLVAVNDSFNRNEILSANAVNVCGAALCNAQVFDIQGKPTGAPDGKSGGHPGGKPGGYDGKPGGYPSGKPAAGGDTTVGLVAVNDSFNRNEILSGNAVNVCGAALCNAQVFDIQGKPTGAPDGKSGGYDGKPDGRPGGDYNSKPGGYPSGKPAAGGDTTVGLVAVNDSFNRNEILSGNAVNGCGAAGCNAQVINTGGSTGGAGGGKPAAGNTTVGGVAINGNGNGNSILSSNAVNVAGLSVANAQVASGPLGLGGGQR